MPDGPPFPDRVRFDQDRAGEVIAQANRVIALLRRQTSDRLANARRMRRSWTGPYAVQFDREVRRMETEATAMLGVLQSQARAVSDASAAAAATQRRHDRANQDWLEQRAVPWPD